MTRFLMRLRLFLKLYFTSIYFLLMILLIPIVGIIIYNSGSYTIESLSSIIYEKAAPIWLIFIVQWCYSIDFDSKFFQQLLTYPIKKWAFILERLVYSLIIFLGLLSVVTLVLIPMLGSYLWRGFAFTIPVYLAICGFIVFGTLIGKHSVGGLFAGILFWMVSVMGGALLGDLNVILLVYHSVYRFVAGLSGFFSVENHWIIYNRLFYIGLGVFSTAGAIFLFKRKSV